MQKTIEFSQEQKSLIWNTKVQPSRGSIEECKLFIEICEEYGLNPLTNDIVFQKFETKQGPKLNFITTRDGYLKAAMRDKNYIRVMSGVVKEGDEFQFDVANGLVQHKFGTKRGKILGGWAIAEHKERGRLPVFVDFDEYFKANAASQKGRSPVWDSMPSAMIVKVAEVFVLRRQFPLGGIVTAEEIGTQEDVFDKLGVDTAMNGRVNAKEKGADVQPTEVKQEKSKAESKAKKQTKPVQKESSNVVEMTAGKEETPEKGNEPSVVKKQPQMTSKAGKEAISSTSEEKNVKVKPECKAENFEEQTAQQVKESVSVGLASNTEGNFHEPHLENIYTIQRMEISQTGSGKVFAKVELEKEGESVIVIARNDGENNVVDQLDLMEEGSKIEAEINSLNGFNFLTSTRLVG